MPKHSSRSDESISPSGEFKRLYRRRWLVVILLSALLAIAAYVVLRPKTITVTAVVPSGAVVYARLDRMLDRLKSLRSSKFWAGISQMNVPDLLTNEGIGQDKVSLYIQWREKIHEIISSPVFKQLFGREVTAALYPPLEGFSNGQWPVAFSGLLVVARPEAQTRVAEVLAGAWNRYNKEWDTAQTRYKNSTIMVVKFKGDHPTIYYARIHGLIFFSVDERILRRVIDVFKSRTGAIAQEDAFQSAAGRFYPSSGGEFFLDVPRSREFLKRNISGLIASETADEARYRQIQLEEWLAVYDGVHYAAASFLADRPLRAKWLLHFDPEQSAPELMRLNNCVHLENPLIGMVPKDIILYQWMGCLDLAAQYQKFKALREGSSEYRNAKEDPLADLEKVWGLTLEGDILPILGEQMGWFVQGVDTGGFFPFPKFVVFLKVKDPARAEEILKRIVTTPVTLLQNETYNTVKINFVTVPLIQTFRPSYAFIQDYLVLATSDKLIKQSLDIASDPSAGLMSGDVFKQRSGGLAATGQLISFMNMGEIARQCTTFLNWADQWFARKIAQAEADAIKVEQRVRALTENIQDQKQDMIVLGQRLETLRQEKVSLEAQLKAAAVVMEAENTLSQEGPLRETSVPEGVRPEKMLEIKNSQEAAVELEIERLRRDLEETVASQPELIDDLKDYEYQRSDAQKYRYYINQVVVPLVGGLGALSAQAVTTNVKNGVLESEMFLSVQ